MSSLALIDPTWLATGYGAIVGLILAISGAGGGTIAVPLLVFGFALPMQAAAPIGLLAVGLAATLGTVLGLKQGWVRYRAALLIGAFGAACAPLGLWLSHQLPNAPLLFGFAVIMAWTGTQMLKSPLHGEQAAQKPTPTQPCQTDSNTARIQWTRPCAKALALTGAVSGLLSGLFGVGGGFVIVPVLNRFSNLNREHIVPTSMAVISLLSLSGISSAALAGSIIWALALPFSCGAVCGLLIGYLLSPLLPTGTSQRSFALLSLLVAILMFFRALG